MIEHLFYELNKSLTPVLRAKPRRSADRGNTRAFEGREQDWVNLGKQLPLGTGDGKEKDEARLEGGAGTWGPTRAGGELRKVGLKEVGVVGFFLSKE